MTTLVNEKFLEWTRGLDFHKGMISIFEQIRDIPYSLAVPMTNPKTAPEEMLRLGKGYCGPKHYLLAAMYQRLGLEVAFATFPFIWNDPDLRYPPDLRQLASGLPVVHHLACRVRINDHWVLVDATWDSPLKPAGFPVNENWDGRSDTKCAVKPLQSPVRTAFCKTATNEPCREPRDARFNPLDGEQDHGDAEDHVRYYREKTGMRTLDDVERIHSFYRKFDAWLETIRHAR
jgi:hypothetical protein